MEQLVLSRISLTETIKGCEEQQTYHNRRWFKVAVSTEEGLLLGTPKCAQAMISNGSWVTLSRLFPQLRLI